MKPTYYVHHKTLGLIKATEDKMVANIVAGGYTTGTCVIETAQPIKATPDNPYGGMDVSYSGDITGFKSIN